VSSNVWRGRSSRSSRLRFRQFQVRLTLADGGVADLVGRLCLPHLFPDLAILDLCDRLAAADGVPQLDVDGAEPSVDTRDRFDGRGADQVADDGDTLGHVRPLDRSEFHRHRRASAAATAAPRRAAGSAGIGAAAAAGGGHRQGSGQDGEGEYLHGSRDSRTYRVIWTRWKSTSARW
jgi:hypothetical protein